MTSIISRGLILLIVSGCAYPYPQQPTKHVSQPRHRAPAGYAVAHPPKPNWKCNPYDDKPCYIGHSPPDGESTQPGPLSQSGGPNVQPEGEISQTSPLPISPYRRATVTVQELPTD